MADSDDRGDAERTRRRLLFTVAAFANLLFAVTWKLWIPPATAEWTVDFCYFPRVPLFAVVRSVPLWIDYVFLCVTLVSSWLLALSNTALRERLALVGFVLGSLGLVLMNQHRLQPWLYQITILFGFAALLSAASFLRFGKLLLISVYLFSAWSKFDYSFVHSLGQQFIDVMLSPLGQSAEQLGATPRGYFALAFPTVELVVGLGLCWERTRPTAVYLAFALHLMLIAILGLGLRHHWGVLIWNGLFIAMVWILFREKYEQMGDRKWSHYLCWCILCLPILEPVGLIDHWPAWQLYAPRNSRAVLQIATPSGMVLQKVPHNLKQHIQGDAASPYRYVDLDAWSLASLGVPIYPQDRFQLGVALAVAQRCDLKESAIVTLEGVAARATGKRARRRLQGTEQMQAATAGYRLNALPE